MNKIIKKMIRIYKWTILVQILFICLNIYLLTFPPQIIGKIIDLLYQLQDNQQAIMQNTIYLLIITCLILIVRVIWKYYDTYNQRAMERDMKNKLFSHLTKLKIQEIQSKRNGEMMSFFVKDIGEVRNAIQRILSFGVRIVAISIIVTFSMITKVDLKLTLLTMIPIILTGFIVVKIRKYIDKSFRKSQEHFTELSEYVQESSDAIRTTKAYSQEGYQLKQFIKINRKLKGSNNAVDVSSTLLSIAIQICFGVSYGIAILYGSQLVLNHQITVGNFVAFNSYITLFLGPVSWLPSLVSRIKRGEISYKRLDQVFALEKEKVMH